jgi:hypothetical protein
MASAAPEPPPRSPSRRSRNACPLCEDPALILDWRPSVPWASIEDCRCDAFYVWTTLLDGGRLDVMSRDECARLRTRIGELRATEHEAWLYTADGRADGPLVGRIQTAGVMTGSMTAGRFGSDGSPPERFGDEVTVRS